MNVRMLREAVRSGPFVPFTLQMNDGRKFHIAHPEYVALGKRTVIIVDPDTELPIWVEPVLIATLHFKSKKNGKAPEVES